MRRLRVPVKLIVIAVLLLAMLVPSAAFAAPRESGSCSKYYTVRYGDTLSRIAAKFGTSAWRLASLNGIKNVDYIRAGMKLCVSVHSGKPAGFYHKVKWGENLYRIGLHYGWSASYLAKVNGLHSKHKIYAGQYLFIPYHS